MGRLSGESPLASLKYSERRRLTSECSDSLALSIYGSSARKNFLSKYHLLRSKEPLCVWGDTVS